MKKILLISVLFWIAFFPGKCFSQGMGIGTTAFTPNASAGLHINFPDKGLLIPQVDLGTYLTSLESGAHGLLVFNTNSSVLQGTGLYMNYSTGTVPDWKKVTDTFLGGTGLANAIAFWNSTSSLGSSPNLTWDNTNSRLGLGVAYPDQQLHLTGNMTFSQSTSSTGNILKDNVRFISDVGLYNTFVGFGSGNLLLTGSSNTALGEQALENLSSGVMNTALGDWALHTNTTGKYNTVIGAIADIASNNLTNCIVIGYNANASNSGQIVLGTDANSSLFCKAAGSSAISSTPNLYVDASTGQIMRSTANLITGTGSNNKVAFWSGTNSISYNTNFHWDNSTQRLGIGTSSPNEQLEITKNLRMSNTTSTTGILYKGSDSFLHDFGTRNVFMGMQSGNFVLTGFDNVGIGDQALKNLSTGKYNTSLGSYSLTSNNEGQYNTAIGFESLNANLTGNLNTGIGAYALYRNVSCVNNIAIGTDALNMQAEGHGVASTDNIAVGNSSLALNDPIDGTTGRDNLAIGHNSLYNNTTGAMNIGMGNISMYFNKTCNRNIAIGFRTLYTQNEGHGNENTDNIAIGYYALYKNDPTSSINGRGNCALGAYSIYYNETGYDNTAIGYLSMYSNTSGNHNTAVGKGALYSSNGDDNTAIGFYADVASSAFTSCIIIGANATAQNTNEIRLGTNSQSKFFCEAAKNETTSNASNLFINATTGQIMRSTSSERYKKDITDLEINSRKIYQLRPVSFTGKTDNLRHFGLIAEEVDKVIPEMVEYIKANQVLPVSDPGEMIPDGVQYPLLSVLLLKEVQKHEETIRQLKDQLEKKDLQIQELYKELDKIKGIIVSFSSNNQ